jgi:hypothetical protein
VDVGLSPPLADTRQRATCEVLASGNIRLATTVCCKRIILCTCSRYVLDITHLASQDVTPVNGEAIGNDLCLVGVVSSLKIENI